MTPWEELQNECNRCRACALSATRKNVVFGVGNTEAEVLFIGEGPGANEDEQGLHVLTATREGLDANALRKMGDFLRDKDPAVVGVLASISEEKVTFLAVCGKEAVAKGVKAGDLVKQVSGICGGKGGGKPDSAMGGGSDLLKVDDALAAVDDFVSEKLG